MITGVLLQYLCCCIRGEIMGISFGKRKLKIKIMEDTETANKELNQPNNEQFYTVKIRKRAMKRQSKQRKIQVSGIYCKIFTI